MFRLTREVRLKVAPVDAPAGRNGHVGTPAADGPFYPIAVRVTLAGRPDARSSYVRNIKEVDERVLALGLPGLREALFANRPVGYSKLVRGLFSQLAAAWPGARLTRLGLVPIAGTEYVAEEGTTVGKLMIRLCHRFEFSAAHRLHNADLDEAENRRLFGKCNNPLGHGHNYEVQVTLTAADGQFLPLAELEQIVEEHAIAKVDHKNLNLEVAEFAEVNPSVEMIAKVIFGWLKPQLVSLDSVTVWETPRTWCEYSESDER